MTFYFYDLETSGISAANSRIMQFAGQRTDMNLKPIGKPDNIYIKLSEDILPDPDAIMVTGITPQKTLADGISEVEFLRIFTDKIALLDTIFTGFNSVRFDDEFMRYLHYRNFYDPYEWQWQDSRSRWDLLDVTRMTRALRPDGIKWPFNAKGTPSNKLTDLTEINELDHADAHDALNDVKATISLARLLRQKQPKLFDYLLRLRDKKQLAMFVKENLIFLYSSGKYSAEFEKTTLVANFSQHPKRQGLLVYDLRYDPAPFLKMTTEELVEVWKWQDDPEALRLPIKTLQFNRCPAVAPLSVYDEASQKRLQLSIEKSTDNQKKLLKVKGFKERVLKALEILDQQQQTRMFSDERGVDAQLYDGFFSDVDRQTERSIRAAQPAQLEEFTDKLKDERLKALLPLYKARNFVKELTRSEQLAWEEHCHNLLTMGGDQSHLSNYFAQLEELKKAPGLSDKHKYLLTELELYGQSLI